jgi:hypothetical protein
MNDVVHIWDQELEEQKRVNKLLRQQHNGLIPVLVTLDKSAKFKLKKRLFLVRQDHTFHVLMSSIRKNAVLPSSDGLFYYIGNKIIMGNHTMSQLDENKEDFLRLIVGQESCFGGLFSSGLIKNVRKVWRGVGELCRAKRGMVL